MTKERILSFAMSEKLSEGSLDAVAGGKAADVTQFLTLSASNSDISIDF